MISKKQLILKYILYLIHFSSKTLKHLIQRFISSEQIVNNHLKNDYTLLYLYIQQIKLLQAYSTIIHLFSGNLNTITFVSITFIFSTSLLMESLIRQYIVMNHNTVTKEILIQTTGSFMSAAIGFYGLHTSLSCPIIPPNNLSNAYNIHSPLGGGYGIQSNLQLYPMDILKGSLGDEMDISQCVDKHGIVSDEKLANYYSKTLEESTRQGNKMCMPKLEDVMHKKL